MTTKAAISRTLITYPIKAVCTVDLLRRRQPKLCLYAVAD